MAQSLVKIIVHVVFSTKGRVRLITPEIEPRLFGFISGIIENNGAKMIIAGGDADHIHILISIGRADIADLIGDIKRETSKWMKQQDRRFEKFYWQRGYGAFSIGQSQVPAAKRYINSQKEHHKKQTFQDEFRELCRKYEVDLYERFCWD
ncbi:MAG: IS200/IS605 family transposase [Pyrinomonadaceae bacterium]